MSSIVKQKVGKHIYLYESVSYRDENGRPRNSRKTIGKVDPETGEYVYKPEYLKRTGLIAPTISKKSTFTPSEIQNSSIKDFGGFYLLENIAKQVGLLEVMLESMPHLWQKIFNLASYLLSTGDPFAYCEDWLSETEVYEVGSMSSQRISELLNEITAEEQDSFYQLWCQKRSENEYLALDITSSSSYSQLVDSVDWGYNRDGENLAQINICLLMGYASRLPIYQKIYNGSLGDVSTLKTTINSFKSITSEKPLITVMDKGFFSTKNVNTMFDENHKMDFIIAVPFTNKIAKSMVQSERKDIDSLENTIVVGSNTLRAITKQKRWNGQNKVYVHAYFNPRKAQKNRDELYSEVILMREAVLANPKKYVDNPDYTKYFIIRKSENNNNGYTVNIKQDVIDAKLETAGWLVIISNFMSDAKEVIKVYREKDVVEKGFLRLKNSLDLARIRVHSETSMQSKVFVGFIALILLTAVHNVMMDKGLYRMFSMKKLMLTLSKQKVQMISGNRILMPANKKQKEIYKAFDLQIPV